MEDVPMVEMEIFSPRTKYFSKTGARAIAFLLAISVPFAPIMIWLTRNASGRGEVGTGKSKSEEIFVMAHRQAVEL